MKLYYFFTLSLLAGVAFADGHTPTQTLVPVSNFNGYQFNSAWFANASDFSQIFTGLLMFTLIAMSFSFLGRMIMSLGSKD